MNSVIQISTGIFYLSKHHKNKDFFVCGLVLLLSGIFPVVVRAQALLGFEVNSFSSASVARTASTFNLGFNPAAGNERQVHWFGIQSFGMSDLNETGIYLTTPVKNYTGSLELQHFGFDLYRESKLSAGISLPSGNHRIGMSISGSHTSIREYGSHTGARFNLGFIVKIMPELNFGGSLLDIPLISRGDFLIDNRTVAIIGFAYNAGTSAIVMSSLIIEPGFEPLWCIGLETNPVWHLFLGAGYKTVTEEWSGGLKVGLGSLKLYITAKNHPYLGWSPGIGFGIKW